MMTETTEKSDNNTGISSDAQLGKLPDDVSEKILSFLDYISLVRCLGVNQSFQKLASHNSLWVAQCRYLWKDKIHVAVAAKKMMLVRNNTAKDAFRISLQDATTRDHLTLEELCYDPEKRRGTVWSLRFKLVAGPDWTSWDPWWNYNLCRKIVFLQDGTVKLFIPKASRQYREIATDNDGVVQMEEDHESQWDEERQLQQQQQGEENHALDDEMEPADSPLNPLQQLDGARTDGELDEPTSPMTWRFVRQPMDLPTRPLGSYIRLTVGGRDVPTYCCRRSPTKNWGFVMESCWGVCASFELPPRPKPTGQNHSNHRRRQRRRLRRTHNPGGGETYYHVEVESSSEEEQDEIQYHSSGSAMFDHREDWGGVREDDLLVTEESFNINISLQWREAFLYNVGEDRLPEGENAENEFARVYHNIMQQQD